MPNGHAMSLEIVRHPGASAFAALDDQHASRFLRQYSPRRRVVLPSGRFLAVKLRSDRRALPTTRAAARARSPEEAKVPGPADPIFEHVGVRARERIVLPVLRLT
jgi:hypothetical protein